MKPIRTETTNARLLPAAGTEHRVAELPITRSDKHVSSCWQMTWRERLLALWTGRVWFDCEAQTHPAIRLRIMGGSGLIADPQDC